MDLEAVALKRIVITGDWLRTESGEPNQWANVLWLNELLGKRLGAITGLPVEAVLPSPAECWNVLGEPPSLESWSRLFWSRAPDALCQHILTYFEDALVVAIELSPILEDGLNRVNLPWIEVGVSPLRFLADFAVFFRFSRGLVPPERFRLGNAEIAAAVDHVRSFYGVAPVQGTVFFAQTRNDRTQIGSSGFVDAEQFVERLELPLWIKPHPLDPENPTIEKAVRRGARILQHNTYATLSADVTVATVSSSVAVEARCFGRAPLVFNPAVLERNTAGLTTLNGFRNSEFWREALAGIHLTNSRFDDPFVPNRLRSKLGAYGLDLKVYGSQN